MIDSLIALLALCNVGVASSSVTCAMRGKAYQRPDSDDAAPNAGFTPEADTCQLSCAASPSCRHFTWRSDTTGCNLFNGDPPVIDVPLAESGPRMCSSSELAEEKTDAESASAEDDMSLLNLDIRMGRFAAHVIRACGQKPALITMANNVRKWARGSQLGDHIQEVLEFLAEGLRYITVEEAAERGMLISMDDLTQLRFKTEGGKFTWPSENKNMYQGDMHLAAGDVHTADEHQHQPSIWWSIWRVFNPPAADEATSGDGTRAVDGSGFGAGRPWTDAHVKYCFDVSIAGSAKRAFLSAIQGICLAVPGIKFTDVGYRSSTSCTVKPSIFVTSSWAGCYSDVGMGRGLFRSQELNLQTPGCDDVGTAMHEILHALGMDHEQSRSDRDTYIEVRQQNIRYGKASQFSITRYADTNRPYDILSLMHYGRDEFSVQPGVLPTIVVKPAGYRVYSNNQAKWPSFQVGQRMGMSKYDKGQLADLYGCNEDLTVCTPSSSSPISNALLIILMVVVGICICGGGIFLCMRYGPRQQSAAFSPTYAPSFGPSVVVAPSSARFADPRAEYSAVDVAHGDLAFDTRTLVAEPTEDLASFLNPLACCAPEGAPKRGACSIQ